VERDVTGTVSQALLRGRVDNSLDKLKVGRCSLTVSKPVLKAPIVSALETRI